MVRATHAETSIFDPRSDPRSNQFHLLLSQDDVVGGSEEIFHVLNFVVIPIHESFIIFAGFLGKISPGIGNFYVSG